MDPRKTAQRAVLALLCLAAFSCSEADSPIDNSISTLSARMEGYRLAWCGCAASDEAECLESLGFAPVTPCEIAALERYEHQGAPWLECIGATFEAAASCLEACPGDPSSCGPTRAEEKTCSELVGVELALELKNCP